MNFQDAIERILHVVNDGNGSPKDVPYVTGSGSIPNIKKRDSAYLLRVK